MLYRLPAGQFRELYVQHGDAAATRLGWHRDTVRKWAEQLGLRTRRLPNGALDMVGFRVGRLTVRERAGSDGRRATWLCDCECGQTAVHRGDRLRQEAVLSCGCLGHGPGWPRRQAASP